MTGGMGLHGMGVNKMSESSKAMRTGTIQTGGAARRAVMIGMSALLAAVGTGWATELEARALCAGMHEIHRVVAIVDNEESVEQSAAAREAFERYVQLTEARISGELAPGGSFLEVDGLPAGERDAAYGALRRGDIRIGHLATLDHGQEIACPHGMIHHWVGVVFIPGATLEQMLRMVQDYDHHAEVYAPDVMRSKLISHSGDDYHVYMRFHRKKIVSVVLDTEHDVRYQRLDSTHAASQSISTRVQEVHDAGSKDERDLPEGEGEGFLWRINSYWRFLERDGGTYVQCESVSLTRDIPYGLGWLIGPIVESVPRESLRFTLEATRNRLTPEGNVAGR